jgi:uncharacterized protein with LGFP repeats
MNRTWHAAALFMAGQVGYPTSDEQAVPGGWEQRFQHGTITYTHRPHIKIS